MAENQVSSETTAQVNDFAARRAAIKAGRYLKRQVVNALGQELEVRQLSPRQRVAAFARAAEAGDDAEANLRFTAELVVRATYFPGTDERVFTDEDVEWLMDSVPDLTSLSGPILTVSGLNKAAVDDAVGKSEGTGSSASSSSSPES